MDFSEKLSFQALKAIKFLSPLSETIVRLSVMWLTTLEMLIA